MSPLIEPKSSPCAFSPLAVTLPLTLAAERSPSAAAPVSDTSPEMLFATSSFGVSVVVTFPLTVSARRDPWTPVTLIDPDTECRSTDADDGTVTGVVDRYVIAAPVAIAVLLALCADVDATGPLRRP